MADDGSTGRRREPSLEDDRLVLAQKRAAAIAAAGLVRDGMRVGLGTGTTVEQLLPALAARNCENLRCAATSLATERAARALGFEIQALDELGELDIAIDGADQIDPEGWLIKGGGGAHTREKIVAASAERFVVIASADKAVARLRPPVPLELLRFGVQRTLSALEPTALRAVEPSPDGGLIADYGGAVEDPRELARMLSERPGVVEHGLFPPEMVSDILIGTELGVEHRPGRKALRT